MNEELTKNVIIEHGTIKVDDGLNLQEHDTTVIRGRRINFFDDVDVYYAAEMLDWEDFRNNPKRKDVFSEKIQGYSERPYDNEAWDEVIKDCMYVSKDFGIHEKLIVVCAEENWLQEELFFVPPAVMKYRKDADIIILKEEIKNNTKPFMHNLIMGLNSEYDTFEKVCKLLRTNYIKEHYKKSVVIAGGEVAPFGLALAQEFSDIIPNAFIYDGITTYSWYESVFTQLCHHNALKAEYMFQKMGTLSKKFDMMETTSDAFYVLKSGYFSRFKINKRVLSPFQYIKDHPNLNVEYHYWKENHHIFWLRDRFSDGEPENFKSNNIKDDVPPAYMFQQILPLYLYKKLDR